MVSVGAVMLKLAVVVQETKDMTCAAEVGRA